MLDINVCLAGYFFMEYTQEDVHVEFQESKHLKNTTIAPMVDGESFFNNAIRSEKRICAAVLNLTKSKSYCIDRYIARIRIALASKANAHVEDLEMIENIKKYWNVADHETARTVSANFINPNFGLIKIHLPFSLYNSAAREHWLLSRDIRDNPYVSEKIKTPRVEISPPYGSEYTLKLNNSLNLHELSLWTPVIYAAAQRIRTELILADVRGL
jgi:hypothetical protein